ncbi:MAG: rhodanese-like domain-containing protein [Acidobacteriota bacterium]|nr:rhodanese-like domain-containing protein [Acidobacteriota bacterium]
MYFKQFYLGCLAHASYLIGDGGEAAVVDPRRDVDEYVDEAGARGLTIRWVLETHLHADFVSGHRELAARTGATIVMGEKARAAFPHRSVRDGDEIRIGSLVLRILETPGHTPESISILVLDPEPRLVLTGDTLFIGDVGRPDLAAGATGVTVEGMAGQLYDSLHGKLLTLPDDVAVYPAHGAGSLCGRNISNETSSTIGVQRRTNYALFPMPKEDFVRLMTADLPEVPAYFPRDVELNRAGAAPLGARLPAALPAAEVMRLAEAGATILDVRPAAAFGAGHPAGAVHVGLSGQFASWAGALLAPEKPVVLVTEDDAGAAEAATRLARVGLENVAGYLDGGVAAWDRAGLPVARLEQIDVAELKARRDDDPGMVVLDVRRPGEYATGHVPGAVSVPLDRLARELDTLPPQGRVAIICASGYRSSVAGSLLLQRRGAEPINVVGGTNAWVAAGYPVE